MTSSLFEFTQQDLVTRKGLKWSRFPVDVIPMWIADTDFGIAPEIKDAAIHAIQHEDLHYCDERELLEMLAAKIQAVNGIPVSPAGVYLTQGVIPAMWLACRYACKPGDEVVVTNPMYFPFFRAIESLNLKKVYWPLYSHDGYQFNIEALQNVISPKTKLLFMCNPHNPTGRVMTKSELSAIADLALDHDLLIACDELWEEIVYPGHVHTSIAAINPEISHNTLSFFGFSKAYNIAGLQIGYIATTNETMLAGMRAVAQGILRGTSTIAQAVAKTILSGTVEYYRTQELQHLHIVRDYAIHQLQEIGDIRCNTIEGTYLLFPNLSAYGKSSSTLVNHLLTEAKVGVSDGSQFGTLGEGHIRMNIGTSLSVLQEALRRISHALHKLS
jgi:bifunctional pyridoxal-dependent enzyme with beta-cystathionase and maltose regulon repressor activities